MLFLSFQSLCQYAFDFRNVCFLHRSSLITHIQIQNPPLFICYFLLVLFIWFAVTIRYIGARWATKKKEKIYKERASYVNAMYHFYLENKAKENSIRLKWINSTEFFCLRRYYIIDVVFLYRTVKRFKYIQIYNIPLNFNVNSSWVTLTFAILLLLEYKNFFFKSFFLSLTPMHGYNSKNDYCLYKILLLCMINSSNNGNE